MSGLLSVAAFLYVGMLVAVVWNSEDELPLAAMLCLVVAWPIVAIVVLIVAAIALAVPVAMVPAYYAIVVQQKWSEWKAGEVHLTSHRR